MHFRGFLVVTPPGVSIDTDRLGDSRDGGGPDDGSDARDGGGSVDGGDTERADADEPDETDADRD
jgi:hypothetical protein